MTLKVSKSTVVKLFEALDFKTARSWSKERLLKKIKNLSELVDELSVAKVEKLKKFKKLLDALLKADKVILSDKDVGFTKQQADEHKRIKEEKKAAGAEKAKKAKKTTKKATKKSVKKSKKKAIKKSKKELDEFGSTVGSTNAKVNKVLRKKPQTMKQIMKAVGSSSTFYTHLGSLIKRRLVKKTDKGYVLAK